METKNIIIENMDNPHELEKIFREEPEKFKLLFKEAWEDNPNSKVLETWYERLNFKEVVNKEKEALFNKDFLIMGILAILAGVSGRILVHLIEANKVSFVNSIFAVAPFIAGYFMYKNKQKKGINLIIIGIFILSAIYINVLPVDYNKDSTTLAYMHLPILIWVLVGFAFVGDKYSSSKVRLSYLKFNGEFCILYGVMAICGMILTGITMKLFSFADINIEEFYFTNVVFFGAAALAVVASYLISKNLKLAKNIAPYIAKIFSPLVLLTLLAYLVTIIVAGKNPFLDRDFLLTFNIVLISVLAVIIFSITEGRNEKKNISDYINFMLILIAIIINIVALIAIIFRVSSYGITPNRIVVLGANLIIWVNLICIMISYWNFLRNKTGISSVQSIITKYLPVYGLWAAFVTFIFPLIF